MKCPRGYATRYTSRYFISTASGKIRNELVKKSVLDETKLEVTVELKQGERFSDGRELTSDDVLATLRLLKNPAFRFPYQSDLDFIDRFEKIGTLPIYRFFQGKVRPLEKLPDIQDFECE